MRFFGLGTAAEKDTVLSELKAMLNEDDCMLKWLYYDLLLSENNNNTDAIVNLRRMVDEGYTNKFTKEKSHIEKVTTQSEVSVSQKKHYCKRTQKRYSCSYTSISTKPHFTHNLLRTPANAWVISPIGTAITFRLGFRWQRD